MKLGWFTFATVATALLTWPDWISYVILASGIGLIRYAYRLKAKWRREDSNF